MDSCCTARQRSPSRQVFFGVTMLLFVISALLTVRWCTGMSMTEMPTPGNWTMSTTWMRMCGQTWLDAAASFLGMWVTMMMAMMLPSLTPVLWRYYQSQKTPSIGLTVVVGLGYFAVWSVIGMVLYPIGVLLSTTTMHSSTLARVVPLAAGIVVLIAGLLQFTTWKVDRLDCCRAIHQCNFSTVTTGMRWSIAWRYGLRLGVQCTCCCAGLTAILLVIGVMNLYAMAVVTAAITIERRASSAKAVHMIGVGFVAAGVLMII